MFVFACIGVLGVPLGLLAWRFPDVWSKARPQTAIQLPTAEEITGKIPKPKEPPSAKDIAKELRNTGAPHAEIRPYITVKQIDLLGEFADGKAVQGQVTVFNSGRTPATDMTGCATIVFRPNSRPMTDEAVCPETDISGPPPKGEFSHVVLGPETPVSIKTQTFSVSPTADALALIESGGANLYVYGDLSYADTALPKLRHHLKFCGSYLPENRSFATCEKHNRMD
jgi:hypothetical protein